MPFKAEDFTGRSFGRWTVLRRAPDGAGKVVKWLCLCDPLRGGCGAEHAVSAGMLKDGRSNGCRRCAAFQRHKDNPGAYLRGKMPKNRKLKCRTCGEAFHGVAKQRFCSPACWPCARPEYRRAWREAKKGR